jgi:acetyl esterase/lipase
MAFVPRVHNRTTPFSSRTIAWETQRKDYEKHLRALGRQSSRIDNKWGGSINGVRETKQPTYPHIQSNPKRAQLQDERNAEIELENYLLLSKLSRILERPHDASKGTLHPADADRPAVPQTDGGEASSSSMLSRQRLQEKITRENLELVRRLQRCRPTHDRVALARDAEERKQWMERRSASKYTLAAAAMRGRPSTATQPRPRPKSAPAVKADGWLTGGVGADTARPDTTTPDSKRAGRPGDARPGRPGSAQHRRPAHARRPVGLDMSGDVSQDGSRDASLDGSRDSSVSRVLALLSSQMASASSLAEMREARDGLMLTNHPLPSWVRVDTVCVGSVAVEIVSDRSCPQQGTDVVVLVHGGMFLSGSARGVRHMAARLSALMRVPVATPRLSLAPEHPFPAPLDDLAHVIDYLTQHGVQPPSGIPPSGILPAPRLALFAESSGCALALRVLQTRAATGKRMPAAAVFASPWVDLTCVAPSFSANASVDPVLQRDRLLSMAAVYAGDAAKGALASPLLALPAAFAGLPPMLIHVGEEEVLLDDARQLRARLVGAGGVARLREYRGVLHAWHTFFPLMPQAEEALAEAAAFLSAQMDALPAVAEEASTLRGAALPATADAAREVAELAAALGIHREGGGGR